MRPNLLKRKLRAGQTAVGCFVGFPSAETAELCGLLGFDFVMIDAEHGAMTTESAYHMVLAAEAAGTTPLIRVPENNPSLILRHLDTGAAGVMVPGVNSAEAARAVVAAARYHPRGRRGLAPVRAAGYGAGLSLRDYAAAANEEMLVICQIEHIDAVENLPAILDVPGIDVLFVGPSDLAQSMGYPGQLDHPDVLAAIARVVAGCAGHHVVLANIAGTADQANRLIAQGFRMIGASAAGLLAGASRGMLADIAR